MEKVNKNCQSCGMPLKEDKKGGGTNADGSISTLYCSYCYENGAFLHAETDVKKFQEYCRVKMIEGGHNKFVAWLFTRGMGRLDRWKKE